MIFIADVSEDINLSGHDRYFSKYEPCHDKKITFKYFVLPIKRALSISQFLIQSFCTQ